MAISTALEQIEIVRRSAERGLAKAQFDGADDFIDIFQHIIDETYRTKRSIEDAQVYQTQD